MKRLDNKKKYTIVQNLDDHIGYQGQPVVIVHSHSDQFYTVSDDRGNRWFCGDEELKELN